MRQKEPTNINDLGTIHKRRNLLARQMRFIKLLRRTERRHKRSIVARKHNRTRAGLLAPLDLVRRCDALALVGSAELVGERVVADAARVDDRFRGEDVLKSGLDGEG